MQDAGVAKGRVSHIISKVYDATPKTIEEIAEVLGLEPEQFDEYVAKELPELAAVSGSDESGRRLLKAGKNDLGRAAGEPQTLKQFGTK